MGNTSYMITCFEIITNNHEYHSVHIWTDTGSRFVFPLSKVSFIKESNYYTEFEIGFEGFRYTFKCNHISNPDYVDQVIDFLSFFTIPKNQ